MLRRTRRRERSERMPAAMRQGGRLVVVGGVAAGMSAASRARRLRPDVEIVVLERGRDVSYGACSLPYYIAGVIPSRDDLVVHDADFFRRERAIDVRLGTAALAVDARARTVACRDAQGATESLSFDSLVLATGARPVKPPLPGVEMPGVFVVRSLVDGDAIAEFIGSGRVKQATVIGAGYIGLEMAEALLARGIDVTVLELLPTVLPTSDPDMSDVVERELLSKGVRVRKETRVEGFEPASGSRSVGFVLAGGQRLGTDMVIVATGVRPRVDLAASAGILLGGTGAIKVDARQVTSEPSILAAGDCSEAVHIVTGKPVWIPLGTTANKQGKIAGENAVGGSARFAGVAGTNVTKILDLEAAQTGLTERGAEAIGLRANSVRITGSSRAHSYPGAGPLHVKLTFEKDGGRLLGGQIVGREGAAKRIDTVATALSARMSVADLAAVDMSYAPPFSPVWDPVLIAAVQAVKKVTF